MGIFARIFTIFCLILSSSLALSAEIGSRSPAPVQNGPVDNPATVLPFAADRIIVKFTREGLAQAHIQASGEKSAAGPTTGLASLDAVLQEIDVRDLRPRHRALKNQDLARSLGTDRWYTIEVPYGTDIPRQTARLAADPHLEFAGPDWRAFPATTPNDPLHGNHWGHNNTGQMPAFSWGGTWKHTAPPVGTPGFDAAAEVAWGGAQAYGDSTVVIAILDSGVDTAHPDLRLVAGYDYGDDDNDPHDDSASPGHGTACAGVAAAIADNNLGVAGIAGGCSVMPLKIADNTGALFFTAIIDAVYHAADNGADVASMSFGAAGLTDYLPADTAFEYAHNAGVTLLAATGNENDSAISYPANNVRVIAVGAASPCGGRKRSSASSDEVNPGVSTDPHGFTCDGERWWGSNFGADTQDLRTAVDILGPTILPTTDISGSGGYDPGDYTGFFNGTSCATPYVAGVAGLLISAHPEWTPDQVRAQLQGTATDVVDVEAGLGWDRYSGYGLVDASAALGTDPVPAVAGFEASPTSGCGPLEVAFVDLSTGDATTWAWDFGDGGVDSAQNPTHTYTDPGQYDVSLITTGSAGADTLTLSGFVTVANLVTAAFNTSDLTGPAPFAVNFADLSSGGATGWQWDFGDGGVDSVQNPVHTYTTPGLYDVQLIATGPCQSDTLAVFHLITVTESAPTADFSADPADGCGPLLVSFTDQSVGTVSTWAWDFGDGGVDTVQNPVHTYADPGLYDVTLIVTGTAGADTLTLVDGVAVGSPVTAAFSLSDTIGTTPLLIEFTDESVGNPTWWRWDFGDGGVDSVQNPTHTYLDLGTHTVTLITGNECSADTLVMEGQVDLRAASAVASDLPARFQLGQNVPNPFNPMTTIHFDLPRQTAVNLRVYDISGRLVRILLAGESMGAGRRSVVWNGKNDAGQQVATGVYLYAIDAGGQRDTKRMILVK